MQARAHLMDQPRDSPILPIIASTPASAIAPINRIASWSSSEKQRRIECDIPAHVVAVQISHHLGQLIKREVCRAINARVKVTQAK